MIKHREPLSMAESLEYIEEQKEESDAEIDIRKFIKKFTKINLNEKKMC